MATSTRMGLTMDSPDVVDDAGRVEGQFALNGEKRKRREKRATLYIELRVRKREQGNFVGMRQHGRRGEERTGKEGLCGSTLGR